MEQFLLKPGWIEVITGCMFSGKTTEGAKRATKEKLAKNRQLLIFSPFEARRQVTIAGDEQTLDTAKKMVSRAGKTFDALEFPKAEPEKILEAITPDITTVIIEEAHFCAMTLLEVCKTLAEKFHLRVIVIGLDQTFSGEPFGPIPRLMVEAEFITKELAVCSHCGSHGASKSWLDSRELTNLKDGKILVGDEQYLALCRHCYKEFQAKFLK